MIELLLEPFFQRAAAAGILLAMTSSILGVYLVQFGMSFLGDGLAHAAFGGVALGLWLGVAPLYVAIPAVILVAIAITKLPERSGLGNDAAIGIFFSLSMALGIIFLSQIAAYTNDAMAYLFGSILAVDSKDVWLSAALFAAVLMCFPLWRSLALVAFDRELAEADRIDVKRQQLYLILFTAVTVVLAIKMIGVVLVSAFLVIPAATAQMQAKSFSTLLFSAISLAVFGVLGGLGLSVITDFPSGASIVVFAAVFFMLSLALKISRARG